MAWARRCASSHLSGLLCGGGVELPYASPTSYSRRNNNTTDATYSLQSGIYAGQPGDSSTYAHNLDLSKAAYVSGRTYDVQGFLKGQRFRWDRNEKRYVRV